MQGLFQTGERFNTSEPRSGSDRVVPEALNCKTKSILPKTRALNVGPTTRSLPLSVLMYSVVVLEALNCKKKELTILPKKRALNVVRTTWSLVS